MQAWYPKKKETKLNTNKAVTNNVKKIVIIVIIIIIIILLSLLLLLLTCFPLFIEFETLIHFNKRLRIISSGHHLREQIQQRTLGVQCK